MSQISLTENNISSNKSVAKSNNALLSYAYLGCFILHALFWCFNLKDL